MKDCQTFGYKIFVTLILCPYNTSFKNKNVSFEPLYFLILLCLNKIQLFTCLGIAYSVLG